MPVSLVTGFWITAIFLVGISSIPSVPFSELTKHGKLLTCKNRGPFLPKQLFYQFYVFAILYLTFLGAYRSFGGVLMLSHVLRRAVEQLLLFPYNRESRMHVLAYIFGFFYYWAASLSFATDPISPTLFVSASVLQFLSHRELFKHRVGGAKRFPPDSVLFKYMYCPHYFAEMLIYISLSSVESMDSILCALFVICSLGINWRNHSLYYSSTR